MITAGTNDRGFPSYYEGSYWIEMRHNGMAVMYHTCPGDKYSNVLLARETRDRRCCICGKIGFPDNLWTLYVLLDGRGSI